MSWVNDIANDVVNWFYNDNNNAGVSGCSRDVPPRQETVSEPETPVQPADAGVDSGAQAFTLEEITAYLNANQTLRQQVMEQICIAPEPHYYVGTEISSLSQMNGRQGQTITGLVIHGAVDDLDLSDSAVIARLMISFGEGIEVSNIRVENNELVVDLAIAPDAATGKRAVIISLQAPATDAGQLEPKEIGRLDQENGFEVRRRVTGGQRQTQTPTPPTGNPFEL